MPAAAVLGSDFGGPGLATGGGANAHVAQASKVVVAQRDTMPTTPGTVVALMA